ncbi:MAG: helix-turn-helix domain-containing protein [Actinomycetota bacterium]|nr:helix-turn-helix domain-containing protein [Actinomycetota bacterium]
MPFAMMPKALLRGSGVSARAIRLWAVLDSYTYGEDDSTPAPSRAQLAADCDLKSVRSIATYLKELQEAGWLTIEHQFRTVGGGQASSRYYLEWIRNDNAQSTDSADPDLAGFDISPVLDGGQDSAHRVEDGKSANVDNPVIAARDGRQDSAHRDGGQDPAHPPRQDPAHPYRNKNLTTKKTTTTMLAAAATGDSAGITLGAGCGGGGSDDEAGHALVRVVRTALPDSVGRQVTSSVLQQRCALLAGAGWDPSSVRATVTARSWTGAGPGAVIRHLDAMLADGPPAGALPTRSRRPPWCGECDDDRTRHVQLGDGRLARCARCHPMRPGAADPPAVTAASG